MQSMNSTNSSMDLDEKELHSVENYLRSLDFNQKNIVTISKTSQKLNMELFLTQKIFDYLEQQGMIQKKYALLCPDCSHILSTDFDYNVLLQTNNKTCCDGTDFNPSKDDIYIFYEVIESKKDLAPVVSATNVSSSQTVEQGLKENIISIDSLAEYHARRLEQEERRLNQEDEKIVVFRELVDQVRVLTEKNDELNKIIEAKDKFSKRYKWACTIYIVLCLLVINYLEADQKIDVANTLSAVTFGLPVIGLWFGR